MKLQISALCKARMPAVGMRAMYTLFVGNVSVCMCSMCVFVCVCVMYVGVNVCVYVCVGV